MAIAMRDCVFHRDQNKQTTKKVDESPKEPEKKKARTKSWEM